MYMCVREKRFCDFRWLVIISAPSKYLSCASTYVCACVWKRKGSLTANDLSLSVYDPNIYHVYVYTYIRVCVRERERKGSLTADNLTLLVCIHVCACVSMRACVCGCVGVWVCVWVCSIVCMCMCVYIRVCMCECVCACVCMCVCVCVYICLSSLTANNLTPSVCYPKIKF